MLFPFLGDQKKSPLASGAEFLNCDGRLKEWFSMGAGMRERDSLAMGGALIE